VNRLLIIPAAGRGSRLGAEIPKVLYPVAGRPMLTHLVELYAPLVHAFVVVVHPSAHEAVERHARGSTRRIAIATQAEPTGMLDAILLARGEVAAAAPREVWITWCDQVAVHPRTLARLAAACRDEPALAFPTAQRRAPYTWLVRDAAGTIVAVQQRREGDDMPASGESEMGVFAMPLCSYEDRLPAFAADGAPGSATRERNFLPFIPWMAARGIVRTVSCVDPEEAIGVNDAADLRAVEDYLGRRRLPSRS
jgi:bifunctional UDP-N-acetylglucosamine pyrophosphorylase/glucosamine-1-phosphate N-acetyltransferase